MKLVWENKRQQPRSIFPLIEYLTPHLPSLNSDYHCSDWAVVFFVFVHKVKPDISASDCVLCSWSYYKRFHT